MSVSEGKLDGFEPVQTGNESYARLRVNIGYYDRSVTNRMQNFSCSSSEDVRLNLNTAGPSVFTHPVFTECRELIRDIAAYNLTDSLLEEHQNPFSNLPHLEELIIFNLNISRLTKDFFKGLPELDYLYFYGSIREIDADAFTGMPNLNTLRLVDLDLEESHLESLKSLPNLEELYIGEANTSHINALKGLPKLRSLFLTYNSVPNLNIKELKKEFPNLRRVVLNGIPFDPEYEIEMGRDEIYVSLPPDETDLF